MMIKQRLKLLIAVVLFAVYAATAVNLLRSGDRLERALEAAAATAEPAAYMYITTTPEPQPEPFIVIIVRSGYSAGSILVNREPVSDDELAEYSEISSLMPSGGEIDETARMIWGEARGLTADAWSAITWVVINRWQSGDWDFRKLETVTDVLTQKLGAAQFSGHDSSNPLLEEIRLVAANVFADYAEGLPDPTDGAKWFDGYGDKIVTWTSYEDFGRVSAGKTWK